MHEIDVDVPNDWNEYDDHGNTNSDNEISFKKLINNDILVGLYGS